MRRLHCSGMGLHEFVSELQLEAQYRRAIQSIAADEYERIPKFRFKDDALQSLIGRLLLRQATRLVSFRGVRSAAVWDCYSL